jgi:hypothetical protein
MVMSEGDDKISKALMGDAGEGFVLYGCEMRWCKLLYAVEGGQHMAGPVFPAGPPADPDHCT